MPLPDPRKLTAQRIQRTEAYAAKIQRMFSETVNELLSLPLTLQAAGVGQMYSFDDENERTQRRVEQLLRRLHSATLLAIEKGVDIEWERANKDADDILKSYFVRKARRSPMMRGWNARNDDARRQFLARSDRGMNLSDRVWQPCRQLRDEMEVALTVAIGEGQDAGTISRSIRRSLNDPDLMFRRFRYKDAEGRWQRKWKKRVKDPDRPGKYRFIDYDKDTYKDQWTGRGYYKSAAQNAMRVARTETNIAYRRADNERWQGLDFVLGQRIQLSKSHPEEDICDTLAGDYPKEFVFDGWHPQCFCFVTPILPSPDEMAKMNEAFLRGEQYTPKGKRITDYPQGFKDFCTANADKIRAAQQRGTEPYFVRNNAEVVEDIINPKNGGNGNVPPILPPATSSATDDDEKKRIEGNRLLYEKLKSDLDYTDVAFNPKNGGLKASHKDHNFDKKGGIYEKSVQEFGYLNGDCVIYGAEYHNKYKQKNTEGFWNGMRFEVAGAENGTSANIRNGLKHCAKKPNIEIAVIFFPNLDMENADIDNGLRRYNGLKEEKGQWVKFKAIYFIDKSGRIKKYLP